MSRFYTFEIAERPTFVAFTTPEDATERLAGTFCSYLEQIQTVGGPVMTPGDQIAFRDASQPEAAWAARRAAHAVANLRIDTNDVTEGYPFFLIPYFDPSAPEDADIDGL